jgi:GT2 family glycosyltransferase
MKTESITIVFSTRENNPLFIEHLKQTCGVENPEILQYVNNGQFPLTKIYNRGLREAANPVIVFTHDDVIFREPDRWAEKVIHHFGKSDFGIIGKAGTTSITESGKWWEEFHLMAGIVSHQWPNQETGKTDTWENRYSEDFGNRIIETILIDGLFFAVHRDRLRKQFDEQIEGFHFYDIDFSLANHFEGVKVGVCFDFHITHKSIGITNEQWEKNRLFFVNKWKSRLPYSIKPVPLYEDQPAACPESPQVAVIVLSRSKTDILFDCINSIEEKTRYNNYMIYISYTESSQANTAEITDFIKQKNNIILIPSPSHHPASIYNAIARNHIPADCELLLFCHDDIKLLNDAISRCVQLYLERKNELGTIGIRLHLPDNSIQHAGLSLLIDRGNQLHITHKGYNTFYAYHPGVDCTVFGNTGSFMLVKKDLFLSSGGFPEHYSHWLEDIDLNIRLLLAGKTNCFAGSAVAYHQESESASTAPNVLSQKGEDFKRLMTYLYQMSNHPAIRKHIKFANT